MEEKNYYIIGAIVVVIALGFITISSYFSNSQEKKPLVGKEQSAIKEEGKTPEVNNTETKKTNEAISDIKFTTEEEVKEKYTIKLIKPTGLPAEIQTKIESAYKAAKDSFLELAKDNSQEIKYALEVNQPKVYQSGDYVSILIEFYENTGGAHPNFNYFSISYSQITGREAGLSDILENKNTNNEIYKYLSTTIEPIAIDALIKQVEGDHKIEGAEKEALKSSVKIGLNPVAENFLVWYLNGENIIFVFSPYQIAPYSFGKQEVSMYLSQTTSALKTYK